MHRLLAGAACAALLAPGAGTLASPERPRGAVAPEAAPPAAAELLGVRINGVEQPEPVVAQRLARQGLAVPADALATWRLRLPSSDPLRVEGREHVLLDAVPGLRWQIDGASQTLVIEVPAGAFARSRLTGAGAAPPAPTAAAAGGYANYDLNWIRQGATAGGTSASVAGALVELGAFGPAGAGRASGFWRSAPGQAGGGARFTRLDSQWRIDLPTRLSSVLVGDAIGVPGGWGRAVRYGGIQWATDFALQPGLVSFPMPRVRGEASVPSVVNLYVNGSHRMQGQLPAGPFDLPDVPVVSGQGQIRMVVRDLLGREQVVVQPYYVSPALLRAGLRDFALEAGALREDYGAASGRYGRAFLAATERFGVSDGYTRELRAELLRDQQTLGATGTWLLGQVATATASVALSRSAQGRGALVAGGIEHRAAQWSASLQGQVASRSFAQLGQAAAFGRAARSTLTAHIGAAVGPGSLGLTFVQRAHGQGGRFASVTVNGSRPFGVLGHLSVYVSHSRGAATGLSVGVDLIRALGSESSVSVGSVRSREREPGGDARDDIRSVVQLQGDAPVGPGWGYRLRAESIANPVGRAGSSIGRAGGEATWNTEAASLNVSVARSAGAGTSWRAGASGGLAWMPEGVFASRRIDGSFAVVKVGDYGGVRVTRDSQLVARTDADGHAFVTGLRGFETQRLGVEAADLPLDAQLDALQIEVVPGRGSGVSVRFPVQRTRSAALRLVTADGRAIRPGSRVRVAGAAGEFPVGFDGRLFLAGLGDRNTIVAETGDDQRCSAQVDLGSGTEPVPDLGQIECR